MTLKPDAIFPAPAEPVASPAVVGDVAELIERLRQSCIDWDKTEMPDLAEPISVDCGLLREAASRLAALQQQLEVALDAVEMNYGYFKQAEARERVLREDKEELQQHIDWFEGKLAEAAEFKEALEQIERYSKEDHVKRRASAALSAHKGS